MNDSIFRMTPLLLLISLSGSTWGCGEAPNDPGTLADAGVGTTARDGGTAARDGGGATQDAGGMDSGTPSGPTLAMTITPTSAPAGSDFLLEFTVTNFTVVDPTTGPQAMPGEGHYHITFNDNPNYTAVWDPSAVINTNPGEAGNYRITAWLVSSVHLELSPRVITSVNFTIE